MENTDTTNEYEQLRAAKRDKLRSMGNDPYGGNESRTIVDLAFAKDFCLQHPEATPDDDRGSVSIAGRVMLHRDGGNLVFTTIMNGINFQVAFSKKRMLASWEIVKLIDLGDIIIVTGLLAMSKTNEPTLWATCLEFGAKSMLPPPAKHEGLVDKETRYRKRYVDIFSNAEVAEVFCVRWQIMRLIRDFLNASDFIEVETPMLQPIAGGATAKPFETHHNALDIPMFLRIAPELYLKRLLVAGYSKVFEMNRNFRNEGLSPKHNPEFTMLEVYQAFGNYHTMMRLVENLIRYVVAKVPASPARWEILVRRQALLGHEFV
jgi:lysyl-tRNA synthetase class 2